MKNRLSKHCADFIDDAKFEGLVNNTSEDRTKIREVMAFGISQIDAGTKLELAGYTEKNPAQELRREQFQIGDIRPMDEILCELLRSGYIPSFCTSCYRSGRTGQIFMEYAIPGFIGKFCTPNALLTLEEYLVDYASPETRRIGENRISEELQKISDGPQKQKLLERLKKNKEFRTARSVFLISFPFKESLSVWIKT